MPENETPITVQIMLASPEVRLYEVIEEVQSTDIVELQHLTIAALRKMADEMEADIVV